MLSSHALHRPKLLATAVAFLVAFVALLSADIAQASASSAFHTPNWSVQCAVVAEESQPYLSCWFTASGHVVSMTTEGNPIALRDEQLMNRHDPFAAKRLLSFGRYWSYRDGFGCVSRKASLRCWNASGHGWWMERAGLIRRY
jgi:hypothetical protein